MDHRPNSSRQVWKLSLGSFLRANCKRSPAMTNSPRPITASEALAKAEETRAMIPLATNEQQRTMLRHIAETWERIARAASETKH